MSINNRNWIVLSLLVAMIALPQAIMLTKLNRIFKDCRVFKAAVNNRVTESKRVTDGIT